MAESSAKSAGPTFWQRVRAFVLGMVFAVVLLIPKILGLRRRKRAWNSLRVAGIAAGLMLAGTAWAGEASWGWGGLGIAMILFAVMVAPVKTEKSVDEHAKGLGALVVVNGGVLRRGKGRTRTNIFVCEGGLKICDLKHIGIGEIAFRDLTDVSVSAEGKEWKLALATSGESWEFRYEGTFGEHLARVAESSIRSVWKKGLAVLP